MTKAQQTRFYFPAWNRCAAANHWLIRAGRLVGKRLETHGGPQSTNLYHQVWTAAQARAADHHRAVIPDDLRHACHQVALGHDKPSADLTNKEVDRVVTLFAILQDPDNLDAQIDWDHPDEAARKRLVHSIGNLAPFPYIDQICRDKFGAAYTTPFWEDLSIAHLRQLHLTLRGRHPAPLSQPSSQPSSTHPSAPSDPSDPF
jgi:hypothetical protein